MDAELVLIDHFFAALTGFRRNNFTSDLFILSVYSVRSEKDLRKYLTGLGSSWELKDGKIVKSFQFSSFVDAIEFVNKVAKIAEELNHHPIITINWKTVKLSLKSFDVDAITNRDIDLATKIEELSPKF